MFKFIKDLFSSTPPVEGEKHPLDGPTKKAVEVAVTPPVSSTWPFPTGEKPVAKKETSAKEKPAKPKAPPKPKIKKK